MHCSAAISGVTILPRIAAFFGMKYRLPRVMSILFAKTHFFGAVEDPAVLGAEIIGAAEINPGRTKVIDAKIRFERGLGSTSIGFT
jgi:hypothetical protein